jgi:hypothetical protein
VHNLTNKDRIKIAHKHGGIQTIYVIPKQIIIIKKIITTEIENAQQIK